MSQHYQWSHLNHLQVGRYAEYFFKMQFVLLGFDVYSAEVDDKGIDFVLRQQPDHYWDVQVKSIRNRRGYVFFQKECFRIRPNLLAAVAWFREDREPDLFLVPSTRWQETDNVFVDREYDGRQSKPEFGMNLSVKNMKALEQHQINNAVKNIFDVELPIRVDQ